jgi:DNA-binding MarR family transcriptional regulator
MASSSKQAFPVAGSIRQDLKAVIETCACWQSRALARRVTAFFDARLKPHGFSIAQLGLMALVGSAEDDSLGALADRAGLDPSTLTRNLQLLERDGLVEIAAQKGDLRRRSVWLTEAGLTRLLAGTARWREAQDEIAALIPLDDLTAVATASEILR